MRGPSLDSMKVLHLTDGYLPWVSNGTEVYILTLTRALKRLGIDSEVAIHQTKNMPANAATYFHEETKVHVLPALPHQRARSEYFSKEYESTSGFEELLRTSNPEIVHFHGRDNIGSLTHLRMVARHALPSVLTYHAAGQSCLRGDLLYLGRSPCDGEIIERRCSVCRLDQSGVPPALARALSVIPLPRPSIDSASRLALPLNGRQMVQRFRSSFDETIRHHAAIVVLARWCEELMLRNGVPAEKLHVVTSGGRSKVADQEERRTAQRPKIVLGYAGRCTPGKGIEVLVDAVLSLPQSIPIEVRFFGTGWDSEYARRLSKKIAGDDRFALPRSIPNEDLGIEMSQLDAVVVPSTGLETGPLTVLDAFASGTPVLGSRLGGIAERVNDGVDGLLFEPGNSRELGGLIRRSWNEPDLLPKLRAAVRPLSTSDDTAKAMKSIYQRISHGSARSNQP